mmetsp:Transcript_1314/g.3518  ORF Transcript_1314/g.3518 Transcript_1314/m.3518 type:complete len:249 (-) Transcript_1314:843-1589(-)
MTGKHRGGVDRGTKRTLPGKHGIHKDRRRRVASASGNTRAERSRGWSKHGRDMRAPGRRRLVGARAVVRLARGSRRGGALEHHVGAHLGHGLVARRGHVALARQLRRHVLVLLHLGREGGREVVVAAGRGLVRDGVRDAAVHVVLALDVARVGLRLARVARLVRAHVGHVGARAGHLPIARLGQVAGGLSFLERGGRPPPVVRRLLRGVGARDALLGHGVLHLVGVVGVRPHLPFGNERATTIKMLSS